MIDIFPAAAPPLEPDIRWLIEELTVTMRARAEAWRQDAACLGVPADRFFPGRHAIGVLQAAKECCAVCPVADPCRESAVDAGDWLKGVWGGTSHRERRSLRAGAAA